VRTSDTLAPPNVAPTIVLEGERINEKGRILIQEEI
jgi:hypothetical protein